MLHGGDGTAGASEGNLVWYGQPSEVQFTCVGGMAEPKFLGII